MSLAINMRTAMGSLTGVQRYALELSKRIDPDVSSRFAPDRILGGLKGQVWEQFSLPYIARKSSLLWSPGNVGPLRVRNQVVTIHDATTFDHPEWFDRKFALWYRFLLPKLAKRVRGIITVSQDSKERLVKCLGVDGDKIRVIHNGVSQELAPAGSASTRTFQRKLGITNPYFAYIGSLEPRKNLETLMKAWRMAASEMPQCELLIAGAGGNVFSGGDTHDVPERCRFVGRLPDEDLAPFLSGARALVYPSLYEGFGLPPLEAMACGTRVAVSDIPVLREVCGEDASYFDPINNTSIAEALLGIDRESERFRTERIEKGLKRAAGFTWERSARLHRTFFEELGCKQDV